MTELHVFQRTLFGTCGTCGGREEQHPVLLDAPDPLTECVVNHNALVSKQVLGDEGLRWYRCPQCNIQVEAKMADGIDAPTGAVGPYWGPGRGSMTERLKDSLRGWAGWADHIGH
jgi:hypothetical protein